MGDTLSTISVVLGLIGLLMIVGYIAAIFEKIKVKRSVFALAIFWLFIIKITLELVNGVCFLPSMKWFTLGFDCVTCYLWYDLYKGAVEAED